MRNVPRVKQKSVTARQGLRGRATATGSTSMPRKALPAAQYMRSHEACPKPLRLHDFSNRRDHRPSCLIMPKNEFRQDTPPGYTAYCGRGHRPAEARALCRARRLAKLLSEPWSSKVRSRLSARQERERYRWCCSSWGLHLSCLPTASSTTPLTER